MPTTDAAGKQQPGAMTREFAGYERGHATSGCVVQLVLSLRQRFKMPLYEVTNHL